MAHFAKLDSNNIVIKVHKVANHVMLKADNTESELKGKQYLNSLHGTATWKQTSYSNNFRKNFARIGYTYDSTRDAFIPPKPYSSWVLNESTCRWEAPVAHPDNNQMCDWDEDNQQWINCENIPTV